MGINNSHPERWKEDIKISVDQFNSWFMENAPEAFKQNRNRTIQEVIEMLRLTQDLTQFSSSIIKGNPRILAALRMSTCPPLARDRLNGLAGLPNRFITALEDKGLPKRTKSEVLDRALDRIVDIVRRLLDTDIVHWYAENRRPSEEERYRSSSIIADRLCGSIADPIIRNAQEQRQIEALRKFFVSKGYRLGVSPPPDAIDQLEPGIFSFRSNVRIGGADGNVVSADVLIRPISRIRTIIPIIIEAKSAGDYANVNKRRKEEAKKMAQLRTQFGDKVVYVLFLCGYFDSGYLGYEAAEGIDWVWEHRISDLEQFGI